jgi:putative colanic acid biosynthesis UDP-glucose lipid carrier transferase
MRTDQTPLIQAGANLHWQINCSTEFEPQWELESRDVCDLKESSEMGIQEVPAKPETIAAFATPFNKRSRRLLQNHDTLLQHLQIGLSMASSMFVLMALALWRNGEVVSQYRSLAVISALFMVVIYEWRGVFRRFDGHSALRLARSWSFVVALAIGAVFFTKTSEDYSRVVILGWIVLGYVLQLFGCHLSYRLTSALKMSQRQPIRAMVVGSSRVAEHLIDSINKNAWMPDRVVGVVDDALAHTHRDEVCKVSNLGTFKQIRAIIEQHQVNRVYIALPISCSQMIEQLYRDISDAAIDVVWVPDIFNMSLLNHSVRELNGLPLITLSESPMMSETQLLCKTVIDKTIAAIALTLLSPLMAMIAFLVWQSSPGPILFKQKRHGWDGRIIEVFKFRSMYMHNDSAVQQASRNDSRITPIGRFIRRTSIDELPQLFNVLLGTMSLVGPRPHAIAHNGFYSQYIRSYMLRHRIKPGMTGLAQINGFRGETETLEKMLRRVEMDIEYINRWSIYLDIKILLKTPLALLSSNAY